MKRVLPHLALARTVIVANVWLLEDDVGRRFLIDTGFRLERWALVRNLRRAGVEGAGDLTAILLTHGHSDHAGNAGFLRERFAAPVFCHEHEAPTLRGEAQAPAMAGRGALFIHDVLCRIEDRWPARSAVDETFSEGPLPWGFHAFGVGGHTAGSALLLHEPTGTLFTGDSLLTGVPPIRAFERFSLAVPEYSRDVQASHRATLAAVSGLDPLASIAPGHGPPVHRGIKAKLEALRRRQNT